MPDLVLYYQLQHGKPVSGIETFAKRNTYINGVIFTKDSPLINIFRKALLKLSEQGVIDKVVKDVGQLLVNKESDLQVLSIGQTSLAFILLAVGAVTVCAVVIIEVVVWKYYVPTKTY